MFLFPEVITHDSFLFIMYIIFIFCKKITCDFLENVNNVYFSLYFSSSSGATDVIVDIENMLANLSTQLDAMLEYQLNEA